MLSPLQFGGIKDDRAVVIDAEGGPHLAALGVRKPRCSGKPAVIDGIGHQKDTVFPNAHGPVELAVGRSDRQNGIEPPVKRADQGPSQQALQAGSSQSEMRLAAHQDRDSRRLCRRGAKHHCRGAMAMHDQGIETAGADFAPKPRRHHRKEPRRLAPPFGAADEPRIVALDEVDIPLDRAPETAIGAAPHRMLREIQRRNARVPMPIEMLIQRSEILDRMRVEESNPARRCIRHAL